MVFYLPPPFGEVTPYDAGPIACAVLLVCFIYGLIGQCLGLSDPTAPTQHPWFMSAEAKAMMAEAKARQLEVTRIKAEKLRRQKASKRRAERDAAKEALLAKRNPPIASPRKPTRPPGHGGRTSSPSGERTGRGRGKGGKGGRGREGGGGRGRGRGGDSSPSSAAPTAISARNELAALE